MTDLQATINRANDLLDLLKRLLGGAVGSDTGQILATYDKFLTFQWDFYHLPDQFQIPFERLYRGTIS